MVGWLTIDESESVQWFTSREHLGAGIPSATSDVGSSPWFQLLSSS